MMSIVTPGKMPPVVYVAHPFGGDADNVEMMKRWMRWLLENAPEVAWIAPWMIDAMVLDDKQPNVRAQALQRCIANARNSDAVLLLGPRVSDGMFEECFGARKVIDLTGCLEPPREEFVQTDAGFFGESNPPGGRRAGATVMSKRADGGPDFVVEAHLIHGRMERGAWRELDYVRLPIREEIAGFHRFARRPRWALPKEKKP